MSTLYIEDREYTENQFEITKTDSRGFGTEFRMNEIEGVCGYNPSLDLYVGRFTKPDISYNMMDILRYGEINAVKHIPSKTLWWTIARNGCSSQLASLAIDQGATCFENRLGTPTQVWGGKARPYLISNFEYAKDVHNWTEFKHVIVYQDPVRRFVRLVNYAFTAGLPYVVYHTVPHRLRMLVTSPSMVIDQMLATASVDARNTTAAYEQHYWPQRNHFALAPKIDTVVRLDDVDHYMKNVLHIEPVHANIENNIVVTEETFSPHQMELAEDIYGPCRQIEVDYKDKFYDPESITQETL